MELVWKNFWYTSENIKETTHCRFQLSKKKIINWIIFLFLRTFLIKKNWKDSVCFRKKKKGFFVGFFFSAFSRSIEWFVHPQVLFCLFVTCCFILFVCYLLFFVSVYKLLFVFGFFFWFFVVFVFWRFFVSSTVFTPFLYSPPRFFLFFFFLKFVWILYCFGLAVNKSGYFKLFPPFFLFSRR